MSESTTLQDQHATSSTPSAQNALYHSLFEEGLSQDTGPINAGPLPLFLHRPKTLAFSGTLEAILEDLEWALENPAAAAYHSTLALHPPRIIRAILDYKIKSRHREPFSQKLQQLLLEAINLGLKIYSQRSAAHEGFKSFKEHLIGVQKRKKLLRSYVRQDHDPATQEAMSPQYSRRTATGLADKFKDNPDIIFVALAYGGVAAGMDVFLRYCDMIGSAHSHFYVVRYSHHKHGDKVPHLCTEEHAFLQALSNGNPLVLFDEDSYTGRTLTNAAKFFFTSVCVAPPIYLASNSGPQAGVYECHPEGLKRWEETRASFRELFRGVSLAARSNQEHPLY